MSLHGLMQKWRPWLDLEAASDVRVFAAMAISQLEPIREDDPHGEEELDRVAIWIQTNKKTSFG